MTLRTILFSMLGLFLMTGCPPTTGTGDDDDSTGTDDDDAADSCADEDDLGNSSEGDADDIADGVAEEVAEAGQTFTDLWVCPDYKDWFTYTATVDGFLSVDATFLDAEGDIDIHMHIEGGSDIAHGASGNDNEMMREFVPAGTTIIVEIEAEFRDDDTPGNSYDVTFGWEIDT
jgi:hypothetical protein